jgi:ligand-binding sensor domain-containing protein
MISGVHLNYYSMKKFFILMFMFVSLSAVADKWTIFKLEDMYSPKNDITSICVDQQGILWIATSFGIYKYAEDKWVAQGPENIYVRTLYIDNHDVKWAGLFNGGVFRSTDGQTWKKIPEVSKSQIVNVINSDSNGSVWIGDWNEGLFNLKGLNNDKEEWVNYRAASEKTGDKEKIGDNAILSIIPDLKNRMWIGSHHGLSMYENGKWKFYDSVNSKLPDNNVYALATDRYENIWVGTSNGLVKIAGSDWTLYNDENSNLSCDLILSLAADNKGNLWVGTNKGVFLFNGKKWIHYTTGNSELPDNRIQSILVFRNKVYIGTSDGLAIYEL